MSSLVLDVERKASFSLTYKDGNVTLAISITLGHLSTLLQLIDLHLLILQLLAGPPAPCGAPVTGPPAPGFPAPGPLVMDPASAKAQQERNW